jgi:hypothetical protein
MKKARWSMVALAACALCWAVPASSTAKTTANKTNSKTAMKVSKKIATKAPAKAAAKTTAKTAKKTSAVRSSWPPETLSAKIVNVDTAKDLVVLQTPDRVDYDMLVTPKTHIESGGGTIALSKLSQDKNKNISVSFVPERRGDVARSIQLGG